MEEAKDKQVTVNGLENQAPNTAKSSPLIKFVYYLLPVLLIAGFVSLMHSGEALKKPQHDYDNVPGYFQAVAADVQIGHWNEAQRDAERLDRAWGHVMQRLQYSVGPNQLERLTANIARIRGAIAAQDKGTALTELNEADVHWNHIGK